MLVSMHSHQFSQNEASTADSGGAVMHAHCYIPKKPMSEYVMKPDPKMQALMP